jgi:hypothetical protein
MSKATTAPKLIKQQWSFSKLQRLQNGLISASFIKEAVTYRTKMYTIHEIRAPLGVSDFGGKRSVLLNLDEENPQHSELITNLSILTAEAQKQFPDIEIKSPALFSEKYRWQLKAKIVQDTQFLESDGETEIKNISTGDFKNHYVDIVIVPSMVWVRTGQGYKEGGISIKLEALQKIPIEEYPQKTPKRPPRLVRM